MSRTESRKNHQQARDHAYAFLRRLHSSEYEAIYLAKRRELEGNLSWVPADALKRGKEATAARWGNHRAETEDLIELVVSMASEPVTSAYVSEFARLEVSTVKKYLRRLKAAGRVTSAMTDEWPYALLWSATG